MYVQERECDESSWPVSSVADLLVGDAKKRRNAKQQEKTKKQEPTTLDWWLMA